jgi:allantoinase
MAPVQSIRSKRVVLGGDVRPARVVCGQGRIVAIEEYDRPAHAPEELDIGDLYLLPGLVDTHVHINDPGRADWEGFSTATNAAAAGGITCLADMPLNSIPATTSPQALTQKRAAAREASRVDYVFWGGVVPGNQDQLAALAQAGVRGFKCFLADSGVPEFPMVGESDLLAAFPIIREAGLPLLAHAELPTPLEAARRNVRDTAPENRRYQNYLCSRPPAAEVAAIDLLINLCRRFSTHVHIVHLSSAAALPAIRRARAAGLPLTVETCPHYLYFAAESIADGATRFKCAPPIRDAQNRELLWNALRDGDIDLIATDHSPCPPALKLAETGDFLRAWGGIASLSVALSAVWTAARTRDFAITDVVRWMCEAPAHLAGLHSNKGRLAPGYDADLVVFDPADPFEVTPADLHFRHPLSPYLGESLRGKVAMTFVRGELVYSGGRFPHKPAGRECP